MKAPLSWLKEYVPIESGVDEIASQLALTGTEVERVAEVGIAGGENLRFFVVGKTLECRRHPDADKLSVCLVDVGQESPRTIVCGAPNVAAGADGSHCAAGRGHARRHPHSGSEAARCRVFGDDHVRGRDRSGRQEPGDHGAARRVVGRDALE